MTTVSLAASDESLICQKCRQPLLLDPTLTFLTPAQHSLITSALPAPAGPSTLPLSAKLAALPPSSREGAKIWAEAHGISPHRPNSVAESFILLSESTISHPPSGQPSSSLGHPGVLAGANLANNLHVLLSSRTSISHPLCTECTSLLQSELQKQLEELGRERDAYIAFERGITRNRDQLRKGRRPRDSDDDSDLGEYDIEGTDAEWDQLIKRKKELAKEEEALIKELEQYEKELEEVKQEEERVKVQEAELERQENEFLLQHSALTTRMTHLSNAHSTARTHHLLAASLLQHLESTNVYHDAFHIGHTTSTGGTIGTIGTINGLRLGGRPTVEWDEINAAWGLVALGIDRIAAKVGCVFTTYKIVPLGSASRIEELPPGKGQYELYASSDLSPARLLQNRRFSHALVALLELLRQLFEHGKELGRPWGTGLGVDIHKDRIAGHSIRLPGITSGMPALTAGMSIMGLGGSSGTGAAHGSGKGASDDSTGEEAWTKACRAVLVALHKILVLESESQRSG